MINTYCLPYTGKRYVTDAEFFSMIGGIAHDINRTMNNVSDVACRKGYSLTKNQVGKDIACCLAYRVITVHITGSLQIKDNTV